MKKTLALASAAAFALGSAHAALVDFTDGTWQDGVGQVVDGVTVTVTGVPQAIVNGDSVSGSFCAPNGVFACAVDGVGVGNSDEVTGDTQSVLVTFSAPVRVTATYYLDLFKDKFVSPLDETESALVDFTLFGAGAGTDAETFAVDKKGNGAGYAEELFPTGVLVTAALFTPGVGEDDGTPDFALAGLRIRTNNVDNPVPVPGALPLFAAGLAGLGMARRKRKA
ncbi:MAG: PEP-CTERM sorting domain-containing protein [Pseudomonadota bacterium]